MKKKIIFIFKQSLFLINYFFNNLWDITFLMDENENNSTEDKKKEKFRDIFFLKIIISIAIISWFKLDTEQIGCIIISNMISELIETFIYYDDEDNNNNIDKNKEKEKE